MTKIPFKPSINHFKTNPSLHHLLVHSKPYLLIYNTSQSILKWGRCVCFTKMTCFPDLLRVKWPHTWMYKFSWVQTTWVRKYTRQAFQRFKPRTKRSSVAPGAAPQSFTFWATALSAQALDLERSNPKIPPWALKHMALSAQLWSRSVFCRASNHDILLQEERLPMFSTA